MTSLGTLAQKYVAIALFACGIVVILQISAMTLAALVGQDPRSAGPVLDGLMVGTWAVLSAQLCNALLWRRPTGAAAAEE